MADRPGARYAGAMRMRFLLLAACGLGATCLAAAALLERGPARPGPPPLGCPALAARSEAVDRIELTHAGQVLWLERRGSVWGLARQGGYPVQQQRAAALMQALAAVRLLEPTPGTLESQGLADPAKPGPGSGTLVRVLAASGATLCALVAGQRADVVRRPGDLGGWLASTPVSAVADLDAWSQHALPPLDPAQVKAVLDDGGLGTAAVETLLAALPFSDVRPRPQVHPVPVRTVQLLLATGTAVLTAGQEGGQAWLLVSGTSPWASQLAPYAFALPPDSPLAGS